MKFGTIAKILAPPLAVLALTAAVYRGSNLTINFPDGWSEPETDSDGIVTSRQGENGANCNVESKTLAALDNMTMAEINAEYGHVFDADDWGDFLAVDPDDLTVVNTEVRPLGDAVFHVATMKLTTEDGIDAQFHYGFYALPGRVLMAGCYATESIYPIYTTTFENTVGSLRPW